jgi:signal peptidase I
MDWHLPHWQGGLKNPPGCHLTMFFLTPRYLKHAKLLHKGVTRFINYKRDRLPASKLDEIIGLRTELEKAIKQRNRERIKALNDELNQVCEKALPDAAQSELAENVEVIFVAIVIALGIRAYIAQPFQIPTGSMQPTLNGITAVATAEDPTPGLLGKLTSPAHAISMSSPIMKALWTSASRLPNIAF